MPCMVCKDEGRIQAEHGTVKCPWCKKPEEGQGGPFVPARERMGPVPSQSRLDSGVKPGINLRGRHFMLTCCRGAVRHTPQCYYTQLAKSEPDQDETHSEGAAHSGSVSGDVCEESSQEE